MEAAFDVIVSKAMYCISCDTISTPTSRCMRCAGPLVPLSKWFAPVSNAVVPAVVYKIKRGLFEDEDQAYSFVDQPNFGMTYATPEEAFTVLVRQFAGLVRLSADAMWCRVANVESAWSEPTGSVWGIIKIQK